MFEGNILRDQFSVTENDSVRRELAWGDLVARLAASRDLRGASGKIVDLQGGGFDQFPKLADGAANKGKRDVNRNALEHGKSDVAEERLNAIDAAQGDRETT